MASNIVSSTPSSDCSVTINDNDTSQNVGSSNTVTDSGATSNNEGTETSTTQAQQEQQQEQQQQPEHSRMLFIAWRVTQMIFFVCPYLLQGLVIAFQCPEFFAVLFLSQFLAMVAVLVVGTWDHVGVKVLWVAEELVLHVSLVAFTIIWMRKDDNYGVTSLVLGSLAICLVINSIVMRIFVFKDFRAWKERHCRALQEASSSSSPSSAPTSAVTKPAAKKDDPPPYEPPPAYCEIHL